MTTNDKKNIIESISGEVSIHYRNKQDGKSVLVQKKKNLITYGAADILARVSAGDSRYSISAMYFQFKNGEISPGDIESITRASSVEFFNSLDSPSDWLRVPIITNGKLDRTNHEDNGSPLYSSNQVTFVATTAATDQFGVNSNLNLFNQASESKIVSLALVATPDKMDKSSDIIFSRTNLISPIPALNSSYIDVFWTIYFL
jgi:hypothetical protein